ncbi:MAG: ribonuclease H-like domain-containing protein [Chloroflexi bacterium]|nr:ribonuclease H-like domain-containing protein [Chloroflexota bacterium]
MPTDLRDRLKKLNIHKGAAHLAAAPKPRRRRGLESLIDGEVIETDYGPAFVHIERYALDHIHGKFALGEALSQSKAVAAELAAEVDGELDLRRAAFIDTETTGLAGGTGTFAFLVGVGTFDANDYFVVRQYFLRSPDEEPAMLLHIAETLDQCEAIVSFNGRGFDLPLLTTRFTLVRLFPHILTAPHLDLLTPSRRLWRGRLESCSLSSLEDHILAVRRDQADISGAFIPDMYFDYLRSGDASEMPRVLYHNVFDILSMVTLSTQLIQLFDRAQTTHRNAGDLYALGKWHADHAQHDQAEVYLLQAIDLADDPETHHAAALRLAMLYKQLERRTDAVPLWEAVTDLPENSAIDACVELAKYFEWHTRDLPHAVHWTQHALKLADALPSGFVRDEVRAGLEHRLERLEKKVTSNA